MVVESRPAPLKVMLKKKTVNLKPAVAGAGQQLNTSSATVTGGAIKPKKILARGSIIKASKMLNISNITTAGGG